MNSGQGSGSCQQLPTLRAIQATFSVGPVQRHTKSRTCLIRDCVKRQQRLAHSPVVPVCQKLDPHPGSLFENTPLLNQKIRGGTNTTLDPCAPQPGWLNDGVGPSKKASRRPFHVTGWRQDESIHLCARKDHVSKGEQVRGPFKKSISNWSSRQGVPDRRWRRLLPTRTRREHFLFLDRHWAPPDKKGEISSTLPKQYLCGALPDHEARCHGISRRHARHDGPIGDPKVVDSVDLKVGIDDRHGIATHFCSTRLMVVSHSRIADEVFQCSSLQIARHDFAFSVRSKWSRITNLATQFNTSYRGLQIIRVRQRIRLDLERVVSVGSCQT